MPGNMFNDWPKYIELAFDAHMNHPRVPENSFRRHDGQTPYPAHLLFASSLVMQEEALALTLRWLLCCGLLLHDMVEDTTLEIPEWVDVLVRDFVGEMSFNGTEHEKVELWVRTPVTILGKGYDKLSNLLDSGWMDSRDANYRRGYEQHCLNIAYWIEICFPDGKLLSCPKMIRAVIKTRDLVPQTPWLK